MIASRYTCKFANRAGDGRAIVVDLPAEEIERARGREIVAMAMAMALKHAYREVPASFRHYDVTPVLVN